MSAGDISRAIDIDRWPLKARNNPRRRINCEEKQRYESEEEADAVAEGYMRRVLFSTMGSYWCGEHECFHLGHDRYMSNRDVLIRTQSINQAA